LEKIESLRRCIHRIEEKCPADLRTLIGRLRKAVGFRNIAVHNYERIDWAIVYAIARNHRGDFQEFARLAGAQLK
jgi:uncharacterized protein YutE (UPF0331/DUF86 family)